MTDIVLARVVHIVTVVLWIGGVGLVTTVLLPSIRRSYPIEHQLAHFHVLESSFAPQARYSVALAGLSGFYMLWRLDAWSRFQEGTFWWMHAMVLVWFLFALMLFVVEPFFLKRILSSWGGSTPELTLQRIDWLHRVLLVLSLLTLAGAMAGSHGLSLNEW